MQARHTLAAVAASATLALFAGCASNSDNNSNRGSTAAALPTVEELEIITPVEATDQATRDITKANVDAAYEALLAEIERDR